MGQLLVTLIVPPIVGMIAYIIVRAISKRDENASGDGVYTLNQSNGTVVFGDGIQSAVPPRGQSNVETSYNGMETVTCHCGAIYETIETKGPTKDQSSFKPGFPR
jgi:hypothetical protein